MISLTKKPKNVLKTHKLHLLSAFPNTKPTKTQSPFSFSPKQLQHHFKSNNQKEKPKPITLHKSNHFPYHKQIKSLITTPNIIKKTFSKNNSIIRPKTHLKLSNHKQTLNTPNSTMPNTTQTKKPNLTNITYLNTKPTTHHNSVNSCNFISSKQNKTRLNKLTKVHQKPIITTTNSIEKMIYSNLNKQTTCSNNSNKNGYDKIFTLLNKEIQEIRDLFKRTTHSVDQQNKMHKIQNEVNNSDIIFDLSLFEKDISNNEKLIDISQLNNDFDIHYNKNEQSILFSSYNSELYKNLVNGDNEDCHKEEEIKENKSSEEELLDCINFSSFGSRNVQHDNNILQIAQNNICLNNILLQQSAEDESNKSEKTECQFGDVVFNQCEHRENNNENIFNVSNNNQYTGSNWLDDLEKTEKTCNIFEEKEYIAWVVPIQEIIKKIRENKK